MRRPALTTTATALALVLAGTAPVAHADVPEEPTGTYVVQSERVTADGVADVVEAVGGTADELAELGLVISELTPAQAERLATEPGLTVEPDAPIRADATQPDPPWGLDRIDQPKLPLDARYTYPDGAGRGVRVYVVDSGVTPHPEFGARLVAGHTEIADGNGTAGCNWHGTHVAGTVASATYGVAKAATVVPVRVLDCAGDGTTTGLLSALNWVVANHPDGRPGVVNLSLGADRHSGVDAAVVKVVQAGLTVVASAGNDAVDACTQSPAAVPAAITVAASDDGDRHAGFSNHGPCVDVYAPGVGIESLDADPGHSITADGTSMAAPHVTGVAALHLSGAPSATPSQVTTAILTGAAAVVTGRPAATPSVLVQSTVAGDPSTPPKPPAPKPGTATERYITSVYGKLFGRAPDPGGLATWRRALTTGTPRGAVADAITSSTEYRSRLIQGSYRTYLDRGADRAGLQNWLAQMQRGMTIQQMEAGFLASPEYWNQSGRNARGWVARLYRHVLGREAAPAEVTHWATHLARGMSRYDVAMGFLLSTEHLSTVVDGHYRHLLGRSLDPTGRRSWVRAIQGGARVEQVIAGIIASPEYWSKNT